MCKTEKELKMRKCVCPLFLFVTAIAVLSSGTVSAKGFAPPGRSIDAIVSPTWLSENGDLADLVILDVRASDTYLIEHIPGSINAPFEVPFSAWITMRDDLLLEIPDEAELFDAIGALGIDTHSKVVVVSEPNEGEPPYYGLSASTRVADTLIYAGVVDVAVLDGGYPGWVAEGLPVTDEVPTVTAVTFDGAVDNHMFVSASYVERHLMFADVIDARDADVYFGATIEVFADKEGHIFGASSLPSPWIWDTNDDVVYTFKDAQLLADMASRVTHWGLREVIVYCGVGGYASAWWFVLTQVLGYRDVKFYDGAAQEWVRDHDMIPFRWQ